MHDYSTMNVNFEKFRVCCKGDCEHDITLLLRIYIIMSMRYGRII